MQKPLPVLSRSGQHIKRAAFRSPARTGPAAVAQPTAALKNAVASPPLKRSHGPKLRPLTPPAARPQTTQLLLTLNPTALAGTPSRSFSRWSARDLVSLKLASLWLSQFRKLPGHCPRHRTSVRVLPQTLCRLPACSRRYRPPNCGCKTAASSHLRNCSIHMQRTAAHGAGGTSAGCPTIMSAVCLS